MDPACRTELAPLVWNDNRKSFEIHDSTDRKIVSFLFPTVMKSCSFYQPQLISVYPWPMKQFKTYYLEKLAREFAAHNRACPVEEYKDTLDTFYKQLCAQINDFPIEDEVSKQLALELLQARIMQCFLDLFTKEPLNFQRISFEAFGEKNHRYLKALYEGQCYHHAFYRAKEYEVMMSTVPFESSFNGAFLLYPGFFLRSMGYAETTTPSEGDLVLFLGDPAQHNNLRFKHLAVMTARGTIRNRWGSFAHEFEQYVHQVPNAYGNRVIFFCKSAHIKPNLEHMVRLSNQMSTIILEWNQKPIPTPLTNLGVLLFFCNWLQSVCKNKISDSETWKWRTIEKHLLAEFPDHDTLTRSILILRIANWTQEFLSNQVSNGPYH